MLTRWAFARHRLTLRRATGKIRLTAERPAERPNSHDDRAAQASITEVDQAHATITSTWGRKLRRDWPGVGRTPPSVEPHHGSDTARPSRRRRLRSRR